MPENEQSLIDLTNQAWCVDMQEWIDNDGENTHRLNYDLNENSLVFDVGGYQGAWAEKIAPKYNPNIYIFEPVLEFCNKMTEKFKDNPKIRIFPFALGMTTVKSRIFGEGDWFFIPDYTGNQDLSEFEQGAMGGDEIQIVSIVDFLTHNKIEKVDLMKLNIEGGEYFIIQTLANANLLKIFSNIQIQFHLLEGENYFEENVRDKTREVLKHTHHPTWTYKYIWENWEINQNP